MKKGQSIVEYSVGFVVVVFSIIAIGFISNARGVFQDHFDEAVNQINNDSGSSGEVETSPGNLAGLVERGGEANYAQAEQNLQGDNVGQVAGDVVAAEDSANEQMNQGDK